MIEHLGINMPWIHWGIFASARRPASVIRTRTTSVCRPSATIRSRFVVASPACNPSASLRRTTPRLRKPLKQMTYLWTGCRRSVLELKDLR